MGQKIMYTLGKLSVYHRVQDKNDGREFINGIVFLSYLSYPEHAHCWC